MYKLTIVAHPLDMEPHIKNRTVNILKSRNSGPLGMISYELETDEKTIIFGLASEPFKFSLFTKVLEQYNMSDFEEMCDAYFQMILGVIPERYETHTYANHGITYKYPLYEGDYLYVGESERKVLDLNVYHLLGYYPLHTDPLFIKGGSPLREGIIWGSSCIIESKNAKNLTTIYKAQDAREKMEYLRMTGYRTKHTATGDAYTTFKETQSLGSVFHDASTQRINISYGDPRDEDDLPTRVKSCCGD